MTEEKSIVLEQGKIYHFDFGGNTQIVGRYKDSDTCNYNFYDLLHYWNGYERFISNDYCAASSVTKIRRASKPEIHNLVRHEIENGCI